jgi:hypothetical protein
MRQPLRNFAIRLVIIAAILLTLGRVYGTTVVAPMLPALAWVIETVDDRLRVDHIDIVNRKADTTIELKVTPIRMLMLGNRILMPDAKLFFAPSTLVGSVLQPVILFLAIILAWPCARLWAVPMRLLLSVPMIVLLMVTNVPLGFVGVMLDFRQNYPDIPVAPLVYWNDFLQTGGPLALAIAAGVLVVSMAQRWGRLPILAASSRGGPQTPY